MKECIFEPQSILVKNYEKLKQCHIIETDDTVLLSIDGFVAYLIPKQKWILGNLKFTPRTEKLNSIIGDEVNYVDAEITMTVQDKNGKDLFVLKGNDEKVYIDKKLFEKSFPKKVSLKVNKPNTPVRVYDEFGLIGIICPVMKKEG
jgi:hypothetical protein